MSASDQSATYSILIDIQARLAALQAARAEMRGAKQEGEGLGSLFKSGLGIGSGMEIARRGVDFFRDAVGRAVTDSSALAAEVERADKRLGLSASGYQTLAKEARDSQTEFQELLASENIFRQKLGEALLDPTRGSVFHQLGEDAQTLANMPVEQATEKVAVALGNVADANVRARLQQELFGRNAAAMTPVLDRLRTQGLEPLRRSAKEAGVILGEGMVNSLNQAQTAAETAQRRLSVALAPLNLRLQQMKAAGLNFAANNAGQIASGVDAGFVATVAAALDKGLIAAATSIEKNGGWRASFKNLGKTLAGPVGIGIAAFLASYAITEYKRSSLESDARSNEFAEQSYRFTPDLMKKELPAVQSEAEVTAVYNKAVTEYQKLLIAIRAEEPGADNDEKRSRIQAMENERQALAGIIPLIHARGSAYVEANQAAKINFEDIAKSQTDLIVIEANHANFQAANFHNAQQLQQRGIERSSTEKENQDEELVYLINKQRLLQQIRDLTAKLPLNAPAGETEEKRKQDLAKLDAEINGLEVAAGNNLKSPIPADTMVGQNRDMRQRMAGLTTYQRNVEDAGNINNKDENPNYLSLGQGVGAGAANYVNQLGSQGEQVAAALQSTLGATVSGITDGIYNWAIGAGNFGQMLTSLEATVFKTFLNTIIQMGVQWLVNAALIKTGMISIETTGDGLRAARVVKENAAEGAMLPAKTAGAAAAGISSWGLALIFGALAVALIMGLAGGFATGGFFQDRPAGFVSGPGTGTSDSVLARVSNKEWISPEWMTKDPVYGPVIAELEAARQGAPGYAKGGFLSFLANPLQLGGFGKEFLKYGGVPRQFQPLAGLIDKYNFVDGTSLYGKDGEPGGSTYDPASGQWVKTSASDKYTVAGLGGSAGSGAALTSAVSAADATDEQRGAGGGSAVLGNGLNVAFLDGRNRDAVEDFKRNPEGEAYLVDVMVRNRLRLGIRS